MRKFLMRFVFGISVLLNVLLTSLMLPKAGRMITAISEVQNIRYLCLALNEYVEENNEFPTDLNRDLESYLLGPTELKEFINRKGFSYSKPATPPQETDSEVIVFIYKTEDRLYTGDLNGYLRGYR